MEVSRERVTGGSAVGDRKARPIWEINSIEEDELGDYESMFRAFIKRLIDGNGSFQVGGNLMFEFKPKATSSAERLISPETAFAFHKMEEGASYDNENGKVLSSKAPAIEGYNYQKNMPPLEKSMMEDFMPVI